MSSGTRHIKTLSLLVMLFLVSFLLSACSSYEYISIVTEATPSPGLDTSRFLVAVEDEPDTVDFQCTTIYYTIAMNVFNRLVEMETDGDGNMIIVPSLAESWEVSDDGYNYTFHLRDHVTFSNGSPLTASDVLYTFKRLLTYPGSCNQDIAELIAGADRLENGETDQLEGFTVLGDLDFRITLAQPFETFLASLSMPGASILDEETTSAAGEKFGHTAEDTIGTGSFILREWEPEKGMILTANTTCWAGEPRCEGLDLRFITDNEKIRLMFENGELDILDLDDIGSDADFFIHGDIYQDRIYSVPRIGVIYIALNESVKPLDDVRVRKALQMSLNRSVLLNVVYDGRGSLENGIYPHGLYGFNPDLPEIPYDPEAAAALLSDAGYPDGFDMTVSVKNSSTQGEMMMMRLAVSMWNKVGIRAEIKVLDEDEFMRLRKSGALECYTAMWTADYNDPDNFIYTFFGNRDNARFRSLCYQRDEIMDRVRAAKTILDADARIEEYQELERIIVQEDAAWIPLFSRLRTYVMSRRIEGVQSTWNGSVKNKYCEVVVKESRK
ncbi:MAG: ABC transporter substrate-binding protein [Clostridia bacterium]|nr:ABC transporter substrate-binding protein [Clostridia bacterium]